MIDFHILAQAILYFCISITGFCISIPVGLSRTHHSKNGCMLYAKITESGKGFQALESSAINCNFPIYYSVFGLIFYGIGVGIYNMYAVYKSRQDPNIGSQMWVIPFILKNSLLACTAFVVACMLSVGLKQYCDGVTTIGKMPSCVYTETIQWRHLDSGEKYDPGPFVTQLIIGQVAAWIGFLLWLIQVALNILRFVRNRRQRSAEMINNAQRQHSSSDTSNFAELEPSA